VKYAFRFTAAAQRQLRSIDQPTAMRILTALTRLGDDPSREDADVKKLAGVENLFRLRVGNWRVAYQIDGGQLIILVVRIGNRREVYRNL
jgi:mRNA interferase RelE/StbE